MKKYIDKFKSLEKGQKIKVVAVTALLLIVLYMILGMFSSSDSSDTSVANSTPAKEKVVTKRLIAQVAVQQKVTKPAVVTSTLSKKQKKYFHKYYFLIEIISPYININKD